MSAAALLWCLFQLSISSWLILDSTFIRSIHLAFALLIVYLQFPALRKPRWGLRFLSEARNIPWLDVALGVAAACSALYITLDYEAIAKRIGTPTATDVVVGLSLVVLLLEAARRVLGPVLSALALLFCAYAFFGPHMPDVMAFKGVSLNRFIGQMTMSTEGVYGIPLRVSAVVVFLFVLFGSLLQSAGAGQYFIDLALSLLGHYRGGPAKAAVLASGLTGSVSGSSIANVVTTGTFTIPLMKKVGYPPEKAAAFEVAASTDGQLAPPIMGAAAFIIAEYVNVPYVDVVKAAIVPAIASYAALFYITHLEACKLGLRGIPREQLPRFFSVLVSGLHYQIPLVFLFYQLIVLRRSPEHSALYAVCALVSIMLVQHPLRAYRNREPLLPAFKAGVSSVIAGSITGARNMLTVALATAVAGIIVGVVAMGPGGLITDVIDTLAMGNIVLMLIITALASLLIGMGLPTTATYIVMATLTAPAIVQLADKHGFFVPLMAAHLFCFYFGILADDTPPVGLAAYAGAAIARADPIRTGIQAFLYDIRTAILPFMFIFNADLILHNIDNWSLGGLILVMACLGNFAFACATQGWFLTRNKLYELPVFLLVTFLLMRPDLVARWLHLDHQHRHWCYLFGIALYGLLYLVQRARSKRHPDVTPPGNS